MRVPLQIISLGVGVQSTMLYYLSSLGNLPRADYAIFADTGGEKPQTLTYFRFMKTWQVRNQGIPLIRAHERDLLKDLTDPAKRFPRIPAFTLAKDGSVGMLSRQCTEIYKVDQVKHTIRKLLGLTPRQRYPRIDIWKGITLDEIERCAIPQTNWEHNVYPFCGYTVTKKSGAMRLPEFSAMTRATVVSLYEKMGLPLPPKSACTFCPYQKDQSWQELKTEDPDEFNKMVALDKAIRNQTAAGVRNPIYLHRTCKPLDEIDFSKQSGELFTNCSDNCMV